MDQYQQYIALSRYARWREDKNRRETWPETVSRYTNYFSDRVADNPNITPDNKLKIIEELNLANLAISGLDVMPSMRCLMTAGKALDRDNMAGFNCSYIVIDHPRAFDEMMYILMCGTGVGYSVERQYVTKLPEVSEQMSESSTVINVIDSKIGWAKAFKELVSLLYHGQIPKWDTSKVRPAGARLKTFGGRASGPEPLEELFEFTVRLFLGSQGRRLTSIECHDLGCKIADVVVVGGVRRSALISLSNLSDDRMRKAKMGQWYDQYPHRALANNSTCYTEKPDFEQFISEWKSLYDSKSGERGIFSRVAAKKKAEENGRRDSDQEFGCNPCCFVGDMQLLTWNSKTFQREYKKFSDLAGKLVYVVNANGELSPSSVWSSGEKPTVFIKYGSNLGRRPIQCTDDHVFMLVDGSEVQAKNLAGKKLMPFIEEAAFINDDAFLAGYMLGDAALGRLNSPTHKGLEVFFCEKDMEIAEAYEANIKGNTWYSTEAVTVARHYNLPAEPIGKRGLPDSIKCYRGMSGLFSANGCVVKGHRVALKTIDKVQADCVVEYLQNCGISSYITTNRAKKVQFSNGTYECKESYDVNIGRYDSLLLFCKLINFGQQYKRGALKQLLLDKAPTVRSVVEGPPEEVFDFSEPHTHWGVVEGVVAHNSEIILPPNSTCNLSEAVIRSEDTWESIKEKVRIATILGTLQSTLTDLRYLRPVWKRNMEEERLLGVSLTGIEDHPVFNGVWDGDGRIQSGEWGDEVWDLNDALYQLRSLVVETNKQYAEMLGINQSVATTTVKPSGTVSQLVNSASGIHPRFSPFYLRRVRGDVKDPLVQMMRDQGVPGEMAQGSDSVWIFEFPIASPKGAKCVKDRSAKEQLDLWMRYYDNWCEHKPSITLGRPIDEVAMDRLMLERLAQAMGTLTHDQRVVFVMCDLEDVPGVEAARVLGVRPGTLWRRLHDARKRLRRALEEVAPR